MTMKKEIKKRYQARIDAQQVPDEAPAFFTRPTAVQGGPERKEFRMNLAFHLALIFCFVFSLTAHSGTMSSLRKIDPDNRKMTVVETKINHALDQLRNYFRPSKGLSE